MLFIQSVDHTVRITECTYSLPNMLISNDLSSLYLDLLVEPLAVAAAFRAALVGAALGAGVEAAQAIFIQAVTQVHPTVQQQPLAVVHLTLGWDNLPAQSQTTVICQVKKYTSYFDAKLIMFVEENLLFSGVHFIAVNFKDIHTLLYLTTFSCPNCISTLCPN